MRCREGGFTLVEMLVAIALTGVITGATTSVVVTMLRTEARAVELSDVLAEARAGLTRTQNELREAKRLYPDADGAAECDPRVLELWVDDNGDDLLQPDEHVFYALDVEDGVGHLDRYVDDASHEPRVVARNLEVEDVFTCDLDPPDTRVVDIDLGVRGPRGLSTTDIDGSARLRNVD